MAGNKYNTCQSTDGTNGSQSNESKAYANTYDSEAIDISFSSPNNGQNHVYNSIDDGVTTLCRIGNTLSRH